MEKVSSSQRIVESDSELGQLDIQDWVRMRDALDISSFEYYVHCDYIYSQSFL